MIIKSNNVLETSGSAVLVKLNKIAPEGGNLSIQVEGYNTCGLVKDGLAFEIIEDDAKIRVIEMPEIVTTWPTMISTRRFFHDSVG
jgi:cysteine synthase|tara:strand:- start:772 stop:1029 length:258 start_codon:yes stop_codon:yes gene_type:complete